MPETASAHISNYEYKFPLPLWVFLLAGALAVLISAPGAAFAVRARKEWTSIEQLGRRVESPLRRAPKKSIITVSRFSWPCSA